MKANYITPQEIETLDYSNFVSLVDERNRCSGGLRSISDIIVNSRLGKTSRVLEIGCNTGFASINLALMSGCFVIGIDTNNNALDLARQYAKKNNLENNISFVCEAAENLSFFDETFDLIWVSNVTSFISNKHSAIREYIRVLKTGGTLAIIPIYYRLNPPENLVSEISKAIGTKIDINTKEYWHNLFTNIPEISNVSIELYYERDFEYLDVSDKINKYIISLLEKPHLDKMSIAQKEAVEKRANYFYYLFNDNLKYCSYSIMLYKKTRGEKEAELFLTKLVEND